MNCKFLCSVAIVAFFAVGTTSADDKIWTGGTDTTWSTPDNWTGGTPEAGDNAVFTGTFTNQPTLTAATATTGGIWMTGTPDQNTTILAAFNLNLGGNTINGNAGLGILIDNTNAATLTIDADPLLQAAQTWRNESGNLFLVNGITKTNGKALTLSNLGAGGTTLSGTITGTGSGSTVTVSNTGAGVTTFSNTGSTYQGQLTVAQGVLSVPSIHNVSANGPLGNAAAGTPVILGSSGQTGTVHFSGLSNSSGSKTFRIAENGTGEFHVSNTTTTITIGGVISDVNDGGKLLKTGPGTLALGATNTFALGLTVSGGIVRLNVDAGAGTSTGTLTLNGGALRNGGNGRIIDNPIKLEASTVNAIYALGTGFQFIFNGALSGTGTLDNTLAVPAEPDIATDTGQIQMKGSLSGFGGTIKINRATNTDFFRFFAQNAGSNDGSNARFILDGDTGPHVGASLPATAIARNNGTVFMMGELSGAGGRIQDDLSAQGSEMTLEVGHLNTDSAWNGVFADQVSESNMAHFTKVGAGTLTLGGNNEYRGITAVNEGTLIVNGNPTGGGAYNVASGATLGGTGNIGSSSVTVDSGGTLAPGASIGMFGVGGASINGTLQVQYDGDADAIDLLNVAGLLDITNAAVDFANLGAGALDGGPHIFATYGSLMGAGVGMDEFSMMSGLPSGYDIDYHYLGNQIALVASSGLPGDFNHDNVVDAADYVLWRKDPTNPANGYISDPSDGYNLWRANFGNPPGSGSGNSLNGSGAVPEPASIGIVALSVLLLAGRRSNVRR